MQSKHSKSLGHGNGSLEKEPGPLGRWKFRFYATIVIDGKPVRKQFGKRFGLICEMEENEAIAAAHAYRTRFRASSMAPVRTDDLPCAKDFLPPGVPVRAAFYGSLAEHLAIVNLMSRGLEVFKNTNPSGTVDLIAMNSSGNLYRVEVKSGDVSDGATRHYVWRKVLRSGAYDILAVVDHAWGVHYFDAQHRPINVTFSSVQMDAETAAASEHVVSTAEIVENADNAPKNSAYLVYREVLDSGAVDRD